MKLNSKECKKALKRYRGKNDIEKLAIKILLARSEDVVDMPGIQDMGNKRIDELANVIGKIRSDIGIEGEV